MKAIRVHEFGGPEVLRLDEIPRPVPSADEILLKVYASGVNPVDWVIRDGGSTHLRPLLKLPLTLGWDTAGVVEEVGSDVVDFKKGDAVFGHPYFPANGSYAEYCTSKASQFALKPKSIGFVEAAGVPLAGLTAWNALFEDAGLKPGQRVLIQGGSGGVGGFAVQFAKAKGAYVIATCSAANVDYVKQLGADEVIDYRSHQVADLVHDVDVVFEASPQRDNTERLKVVPVLKKGGVYVIVNLDTPYDDAVREALARQGATGKLSRAEARKGSLDEIAKLIDAGKVKVFVSRVYPLAQAADAHRESQTRRVRGKLVLKVLSDSEASPGSSS